MRALPEESLLRQLDVRDVAIGGLLLRCQVAAVLFALLALDGNLCSHGENGD